MLLIIRLLLLTVVEVGDDITPCLDQRTLVLVNHQSTADVPLLMTTFNTKQEVLPNVMWIMDKVFMYTNFGIVSVIHKDFFIGSVSCDDEGKGWICWWKSQRNDKVDSFLRKFHSRHLKINNT